MIGLIGKKVGMTQIFDDKGEVIPVTVIEAGPCTVTELRSAELNGYAAVQLGIVGQVHRAHAPLAQPFDDAITAELLGHRPLDCQPFANDLRLI